MSDYRSRTKKRLKSFLSGLLCLAMLLAQMPLAFAAEERTISTAADLTALAEEVNAGAAGEELTIKLTQDIDLSGQAEGWTPIGSTEHPFTGMFDGGGHTIRGLEINASSENQGLFGVVSGSAVICDLTVDGRVAAAGANTGGVIGCIDKNAVNARVSGVTNLAEVSGATNVGGIVGLIESGAQASLENCVNNGPVNGSGAIAMIGVGGIAGSVQSASAELVDCTNRANLTDTSLGQGGIAGINAGTIAQCVNEGSITKALVISINTSNAAAGAGGIVGNNNAGGTVINCTNRGDISATITVTGSVSTRNSGFSMGGVAGINAGAITSCENSAAVTWDGRLANTRFGLGGVAGKTTGTLYDCSNSGSVSLSNGGSYATPPVGGVAGYLSGGTLRFCRNTGAVSGDTLNRPVGGVAGYLDGAALLGNSWSSGTVTTGSATVSGNIGGIFGQIGASASTVRNCIATGAIRLTNESLAAGKIYGFTIGNNGSSTLAGTVENCVYACADNAQSAYLLTVNNGEKAQNCFVSLDGTSFTSLNGSQLSAGQVLAALNSKMWKLEDGALSLLDYVEFKNLTYDLTIERTSTGTAADQEPLTAALTQSGTAMTSPVSVKLGDELQLVITVPENAENRLLVVSASDSTALQTAGDRTYRITVGEEDLTIRYAWVDTTQDAGAWYTQNPAASNFTITRPEELLFLGQLTAGTAKDAAGFGLDVEMFAGKKITLGADLDLASLCHPANGDGSERSWPTIRDFSGTFDGQGHTISNLYINTTEDSAALFAAPLVGTAPAVWDLNLVNASVTSTGQYVGTILAGRGLAAGCTVKNSTVRGGNYTGGVMGGYGTNSLASANECTVENSTVAGGNYVGGVIGRFSGSGTGSNYALRDNLAVNTNVTGADYVGGVAGHAAVAQNTGTIYKDQALDCKVSGVNYVGGVFGYLSSAYNGMTSSTTPVGGGFISTAEVTATGDWAGGIAGQGFVDSAIYYAVREDGTPKVSGGGSNVGPLVGEAVVMSGNAGTTRTAAPTVRSAYLSETYTADGFGIPAASFRLDEALYLLQGGKGFFWALNEDGDYPTFNAESQTTLYKLTLTPLEGAQKEGCSVGITPSGGSYAYHIYQDGTGNTWTYAPQGTEIVLSAAVPEGIAPKFYPVGTVSASEAGGYTVSLSTDTVVEYAFAAAIDIDTSWYDSENPQTSYTLTTESQLRGLAQLVNGGNSFAGVTLMLGNDIELAGGEWTPIGDAEAHPFSGVFRGNGHTIDGLYFYGYTGTSAGLFGYLSETAVVSGLTVNGMVDSVGTYAGGIAGYSKGSLSDVTSGVKLTIQNAATAVAAVGRAGGVVGYQAEGSSLNGAVFTGTVTSKLAGSYVGGLTGENHGTISNSENRGSVGGLGTYAGGIAGSNSAGTITDCVNYGEISTEVATGRAGGIVGYGTANAAILRCGNEGSVCGTYYVGGVAGYVWGAVIDQTYNKGAVSSTYNNTNARAGGLVGYMYAYNTYKLNILGNSYNLGTVQGAGNGNMGGAVGNHGGTGGVNAIYNCYTTTAGSGGGLNKNGGILGNNSSTSVALSNCYSLEGVTEVSAALGTGELTQLSTDEFRNAAEKLSPAFADSGSGTPVLHWEIDPETGVTLNYHDSQRNALDPAGQTYAQPDIVVVLSPEDAAAAMAKPVIAGSRFGIRGWYSGESEYSSDVELKNGDFYTAEWGVTASVTLAEGSRAVISSDDGLADQKTGGYIVLLDADARGEFHFTVTPDSGYSVGAVTANGTALSAGADGVYTLTVTGDTAIAVSVKKTDWNSEEETKEDIESVVDSVANGTQEKDSENSTYDEALDYNDDGKNDLLDILDILYQQKNQPEASEQEPGDGEAE